MEIALNSAVVASSPSLKKTATFNGFLPAPTASHRGFGQTSSSGIYSAGGGFKNDIASNANSSLALLAALTLKGAFNGTNNNNNRQQQHHVGFMSNNTAATTNDRNIFSFTTAGIAAAADTITSSSNANILSLSSLAAATNNKISNKSTTKSSSSSTTLSSSTSSAAATSTTNSNLINSNNSNVTNLLTTPTVTTTATSTSTIIHNNVGGKNHFQIPSDILDDLASRFIINVPDMELSNLIRICFQIELAHWFYLDFFCAIEEKKLQPCGMKPFAMQIFQHIPFLHKHLSSIDKTLDDWKNYKLSVPTYGAILISEDLNYCLLVQSYFAKCSWGFPKGKVNENEDPVHCAAREVYEETGYDITELIVPNDYIEAVINYQYTRLYIVRNVSLQTQFSPRTRNEIKCCDWFPIDSLPINKNDAISKAKLGINANSFFMIMPFIKRLKKWVNDKRSGIETRRKFSGGVQNIATPTSSSTSPVTAINVTEGRAGGINQKNANNSCKKNKQQYNDDNNALNNGEGGAKTGGTGGGSNSNANSNRSKRQRHKSMGDLDGIKLNNLSNNSTNSNCKTNNKNNSNNVGTKIAADHHSNTNGCNMMSSGGNGMVNGNGGSSGSNHKRNSAKNSGAGNGNNITGSTKRQLFHSQSQCATQNGEKIVSSFDLIRKEKQQMKAAAQAEKTAKAQKQQQQPQTNGGGGNIRVRAKSQSDKICSLQQQQQHQQQNTNNKNNINNNKQRLQKQQSMIVTNSNMVNNINNSKMRAVTTAVGHITPPPISGAGLLAITTAAAAADIAATTTKPVQQGNNSFVTSPIAITSNGATRPRPVSVSYVTPQASIIKNTTSITTTTKSTSPPLQDQQQHQLLLQRMASGPNLRILKRAHSYQPQQLQQQQPKMQLQQQQLQRHQQHLQQQQQQPVKFTPSFNSWTNFSFTKNFIANVFC